MVEGRLRDLAIKNGKSVEELVGFLLEEKTEEIYHRRSGKKKLTDLAGIFYGGDGNTSENAEKILMSEVDKIGGFEK